MRQGNSLIHRSDRCSLGIEGVDQRRTRIHLGKYRFRYPEQRFLAGRLQAKCTGESA